jgi:glucose-6-phosphate 1-dehydrogenase
MQTLTSLESGRSDQATDPSILVIFGASGDLAQRMLLPALYDLACDRSLPARFGVLGLARSAMSDEEFRDKVKASVKTRSRHTIDDAVWDNFAGNLRYLSADYEDPESFDRLAEMLGRMSAEMGTGGNVAYYLAVPPTAMPGIIEGLRDHHNGAYGTGAAWHRLIVEKPFGYDVASARGLNALIHTAFPEDAVYRMDHYLGKETVQNILVFRFANGVFEPTWNRRYVDHVQITVAESLGVGERGGYYDTVGAMRDIVQNHMVQLLALVAMEPPTRFDGNSVRNEKVKAVSAVRRLTPDEVPLATARGQYGPGWIGGEQVKGYREEVRNPESTTETFAAARLFIDNWRWADVPFYLRTGKRLAKRSTEIAIQFRRAPLMLFQGFVDEANLEPTILTMRIQPNEGISMKFLTKVPGSPMRIRPAMMDFMYGAAFLNESPSAYETLILDALQGDSTLFTRADEVESAWEVTDVILDNWREAPPPALPNYEAGTFGPDEADDLIERDGRSWRRL